MRSLKILLGGIFLILLSLIVVAFKMANNTETTSQSKITEALPAKNPIDKAAVQRYHEQRQKLQSALQLYFDKAIANRDIVGAGVSIIQGDSILFSNGFGKRSFDTDKRVDGKTVFRLGSLSKGFTGVLAASLQVENTLDLNKKLTEYVPQFQLGDSSHTQKITLSHVLSHSAGTPYHSYTNLVEAGLPMSEIAKRFNEVNPISEPGMMYSYQNAIFALSQEAMKKATGKDMATLLKNRFLIPLGMTSVSMDHNTLTKARNVALPHARYRRGWKKLQLRDRYYNAIAAGGINASSLDMAKWMRFLLGHNPEVLPQSAIQEAFCPSIDIKYNNKYYQRWPNHVQSHYGFGWRIHTFRDDNTNMEQTVWHHGGSVNNYRNEIALYPAEDLGICVLLNSNSKMARHVIPDLYSIVEEVFRETPEDIL